MMPSSAATSALCKRPIWASDQAALTIEGKRRMDEIRGDLEAAQGHGEILEAEPDMVFVAWAGATSGAMWQSLNQQGVLDDITVVTDIDGVMRGIGRMRDAGKDPVWGPGRHGPGNNRFVYFHDNDETPGGDHYIAGEAMRTLLRKDDLPLLVPQTHQ